LARVRLGRLLPQSGGIPPRRATEARILGRWIVQRSRREERNPPSGIQLFEG
jgi:hypothetical protein